MIAVGQWFVWRAMGHRFVVLEVRPRDVVIEYADGDRGVTTVAQIGRGAMRSDGAWGRLAS